MAMFLAATLALSIPPVPPAPPSAPCPAIEALASDATASDLEGLVRAAAAAMAGGDRASAESLARRALGGSGPDVDRAWAARLLVDLGLARGDMSEAEAILACNSLQGEAWTHARAWLAYRQRRYAEAVLLLQPLTRPRHHSLPRWSIVHEDLGDSFARLGRTADAHAQWRIALATDHDPGPTGWDREALAAKLADAVAAPGGAPAMLPLQYWDDAVSILDMASIQRTEAGVRFSKLVLLESDNRDTAYGIDSWEVRCDEPESRVLSVRRFNAAGEAVGGVDQPARWRRDLPGDPWLGTERALVCAVEPGMALAPRQRTDAELLRAYRAGDVLFD